MKDRERIYEYVKNKYLTDVDFPFESAPFHAVLRHRNNKKWYGLIMEVKKKIVGYQGDGLIDIINVKCYPEIIGDLRMSKGFCPAYHMNKEHWITIILDDCITFEEIKQYIDISYQLTKK